MSGFGIFAPDAGIPGRTSRKGGGVLSNAGARVAGAGSNPISWGDAPGAAGGAPSGAAYGGGVPQDEFPPAGGYRATQIESQQQLAMHNAQAQRLAAAQQQYTAAQQQAAAQAHAYAQPQGQQRQGVQGASSQAYGQFAAQGKAAVPYRPIASNDNPISGVPKGVQMDGQFQSEASRQFADPTKFVPPNTHSSHGRNNDSSNSAYGAAAAGGVSTNVQAAGAPSSYNPRDAQRGIGTAQAMGFGSSAAPAPAAAPAPGPAAAGAPPGTGAGRHGGGMGSGDFQSDAARAMLAARNKSPTPNPVVPSGLNGIAQGNARSMQEARMKQLHNAPLDPATFYYPEHHVYGKKNPQNRFIKSTYNIINTANNDAEAQRLAQATFRTTNMQDFTDKGIAVRRPIVPPHPSTTSMGPADGNFDGKTTAGESYPKYEGAKPATPAHAVMGGGTDAVFKPEGPSAQAGAWQTEAHGSYDASKLHGASPSKPVFDRSTQQMTHMSHYDPNAKFDAVTTSSQAYHPFAGHRPPEPYKPRGEEGNETILAHASAVPFTDAERFQTEQHSRFQHGKATRGLTPAHHQQPPQSQSQPPGAGAHRYTSSSGNPMAPQQQQQQPQPQPQGGAAGAGAGAAPAYRGPAPPGSAAARVQMQQQSSVFASGPAAGGQDMPFVGGKARATYQNNSTGVSQTMGINASVQQPQYQTQHELARGGNY